MLILGLGFDLQAILGLGFCPWRPIMALLPTPTNSRVRRLVSEQLQVAVIV